MFAFDVNGQALNISDNALILATPKNAIKPSPNTDAKKAASWIYRCVKVLKVTGANRAVVHLPEGPMPQPLFEIDSVMLEKI